MINETCESVINTTEPHLICNTKYPVVLIHGTGFRDRKLLNYWGRIPKSLEQNGAKIFYCNQDAWGTIEENAHIVKQRIFDIINETGSDKVNIIAHSKGGLEARYAVSVLGLADYVASLTTISTPHQGSKTIDFVCKFPKFIMKFTAFFVNLFFRILGDKKPDFYNTYQEFSTKFANQFNETVINSEKVYYQSYVSVMKNSFSDVFLFIPHFIIKIFDGDNDGIVSAKSAVWGEFKGIIRGKGIRGVSHADMVDMRRMNFAGIDIRNIYIDILKRLKKMGF